MAAELMFGRNIRTKLNLIKRSIGPELTEKKLTSSDNGHRSFKVGDKIQARNYSSLKVKWDFDTVVKGMGFYITMFP